MPRTVRSCPRTKCDGEVAFGPAARRVSCDACGTTFNVVLGELRVAREDFNRTGMSRRGWAGSQS